MNAPLPSCETTWRRSTVRATRWQELNRLDEAVSIYDRAIALEPATRKFSAIAASPCPGSPAMRKAIASFDRAIASDATRRRPIRQSRQCAHAIAPFEEALASYDKALPRKPDDARSLYGRASALVEVKRHDEAIARIPGIVAQQTRLPLRARHARLLRSEPAATAR
jgi:tetratricopeptide (TPR) repeat protein